MQRRLAHLIGVINARIARAVVLPLKGHCAGQLVVPRLSLGHYTLHSDWRDAHPGERCSQLLPAPHLVRAAVVVPLDQDFGS